MSKFCQLVIGPAGGGKSTYCETIQTYASSVRRRVEVINLDPANDFFPYQAVADIKELISLEDVMDDEELALGPNGGLIYCMEYLCNHFEWLKELLEDGSDDYVLFDCPGQIELYCHSKVMTRLLEELTRMDFNVCTVFIMDSQFLTDPLKFVSGTMCALSSIVNIEAPSFCVLSKVDLLDPPTKENLEDLLEPSSFLQTLEEAPERHSNNKFKGVMEAIATVIDNYGLVRLIPLDITDPCSIEELFSQTDSILQYSDHADVKTKAMDNYLDQLE